MATATFPLSFSPNPPSNPSHIFEDSAVKELSEKQKPQEIQRRNEISRREVRPNEFSVTKVIDLPLQPEPLIETRVLCHRW